MRGGYVMLSFILFTIGFMSPIYKELGNETFKLVRESGDFNWFYILYVMYGVINLWVSTKIVKKNESNPVYGFINLLVMVGYLFYMFWETGKTTYVVALILGYLLVLVIQLVLVGIRSVFSMMNEEDNELIEEKAKEFEEQQKKDQEAYELKEKMKAIKKVKKLSEMGFSEEKKESQKEKIKEKEKTEENETKKNEHDGVFIKYNFDTEEFKGETNEEKTIMMSEIETDLPEKKQEEEKQEEEKQEEKNKKEENKKEPAVIDETEKIIREFERKKIEEEIKKLGL